MKITNSVTGKDIDIKKIIEKDAERLLKNDVKLAQNDVKNNVKVNINENGFD